MVRMSLALLLAWAILSDSAYAQVHYTCDAPVGTIRICRDSNGDSYTIVKDPTGSTITDSDGHMARVQKDPVMGAVIHNEDGSSIRVHTDASGNTIYEDEEGNQTRCRPSHVPMPGQTDTDMDCQ